MGKCQYCGLSHEAKCPSVKAIEYHPDGTVKRVEFFSPVDYMQPLNPSVWPWPTKPLEPYCYGPGTPYFGAWHDHIATSRGGA